MIPEKAIENKNEKEQNERKALEHLIYDAQKSGDKQKIVDAIVALKSIDEY